MMRIGICQHLVTDAKDENISRAVEMIIGAASDGAEIVVLPEMFNCPYDINKFREYAETEAGKTLTRIREVAEETGVYIVAGSIPEKTPEGVYNTSFIIDNNGLIVGRHRKVHLFDIDVPGKISFRESDTLIPGKNVTVVKTRPANLGIGICYDIRFPELSRMMVLAGATVLIFPGAFNMITGPAHWRLLLRARALDNQSYVVGVSQARNNEASYIAYGHSMVADPWGRVLFEADETPQFFTVEIDVGEVQKVRSELPVLKNRRPSIYGWGYGIKNVE